MLLQYLLILVNISLKKYNRSLVHVSSGPLNNINTYKFWF